MYIILTILAFSILILGHEFGHFVMAKVNGVMVEEFSIGMGPKLFSIKAKETAYSIRLLPIGGFVKMLGDDTKSTDPRAFNTKHPGRKLSIVCAGPLMNVILAILFFAIYSTQGFQTPVVSKIVPDSPAQSIGIQAGDKIVKLNNKKVDMWEDLQMNMQGNTGQPMNISVLRNGVTKSYIVTPIKNTEQNQYIIGVYPSVKYPNLFEAVGYGLNETKYMVKLTGQFFQTLFHGKASYNDVGGPITLITVTGTAAKAGIMPLLFISAYISIQLAIFNIIPFPALDGGYIFLFLFQIITKKEIDDNKVGVLNYIGFVLLMTLMVLVTIKDIIHPIHF